MISIPTPFPQIQRHDESKTSLQTVWNVINQIETPRANADISPNLEIPRATREMIRDIAWKLSYQKTYQTKAQKAEELEHSRRSQKRTHAAEQDDFQTDDGQQPKRLKYDDYDPNEDRTSIDGFVQVRPPLPLHPQMERDDQWFTENMNQLYNKVVTFVETFFCNEDMNPSRFQGSPWLIDLPPQFLNYTQIVAEPDRYSGGWDDLLVDKQMRKWLLVGIIAKILEVHVFGELLFGATEAQEETLRSMDIALIDSEGFTRTPLRASFIRTAIGSDRLTDHFWKTTAALSQQIFELLRPLSNKLRLISDYHPADFPPAKAILQGLNDVVARAAFLSLAIRVSPTIFLFSFEQPGAPFNREQHSNVDFERFTESKQNVKTWIEDEKTFIERKEEELRAQDESQDQAEGDAINITLSTPRPENFSSLVQISVWPSIKRFKPGDGSVGGEQNGFRIYDVYKHRVQCFWAEGVAGKDMLLKRYVADIGSHMAGARFERKGKQAEKERPSVGLGLPAMGVSGLGAVISRL